MEYDNSTTTFQFGTSDATLNHTSTGASIMLIGVASNTNSTAVKVDGIDATLLESINVGTSYYLHLWVKTGFTNGTNGITSTIDGSGGIAQIVIVSTYKNSDLTGDTTTNASITNTPSIDVDSGADNLVIDFMLATDEGTHNSVTAGANQTQRASDEWNGNYRFVSSDKAGAASTTMTWTIDKTGSAAYTLHLGVSLNQVSGFLNFLP